MIRPLSCFGVLADGADPAAQGVAIPQQPGPHRQRDPDEPLLPVMRRIERAHLRANPDNEALQQQG